MRVSSPELLDKASLKDLEDTICTPDGVGQEMKRRCLEKIKNIISVNIQIDTLTRYSAETD